MKLLSKAKRMILARVPGGRRHCAACDTFVWTFIPYRGGTPIPLMDALEGVGSDVRNFECPACGAHDRERHLILYLRALRFLDHLHGKSVLHFAPEKRLSEHIAQSHPARYVQCDLHPQAPSVQKVDLLSMPFPPGSFDVLIANHVLEHVADDLAALAAIKRVLKIGGYAILQTPYARKLHETWQDAGLTEPTARLQAYGQEDHVRLYGSDLFERIASTGLVSAVRTHAELLPDIDPFVEGVNPAEPLFFFRKDTE